jgi:putative zinc finger/helix-turn-helix YgiT family protein
MAEGLTSQSEPITCIECGGLLESELADHRFIESGLPYVVLKGVEVRTCHDCGEQEIGIPYLEGLLSTLAETLAAGKARLKGAEVRFLRKHLELSGCEFAAVMGVEPETVSRWENDRQPISKTAERLLRLIVRVHGPRRKQDVSFLRALASKPAKRPPRLSFAVQDERWEAAAR